jgi:hypothetical protein
MGLPGNAIRLIPAIGMHTDSRYIHLLGFRKLGEGHG